MSVVFEAVHDLLKTRHAVKVLEVPPDGADAKTLSEKFLAEARLLATLRHPGIVRVTDIGVLDDGRSYFIMDRLEGGSLAERLASGEPPDPATVRAWYAGLRQALALCHRRGIVHGDIKPENVLIDADGQLVLTDFGIARLTDPAFRAGLGLATVTLPGNFGTPYTLAPECRRGEKAATAADVYSFGVLLFKCLTGLWFEGSPRLLNEIDAAFPEWSSLLRRMLAREPSDRFASANDLPDAAPLPNAETDREAGGQTASLVNPPRYWREPHAIPEDGALTTELNFPPPKRHGFLRTVRNWFLGSLATIFLILLVNYTWKFFHMYNIRATHPDWLEHVFP